MITAYSTALSGLNNASNSLAERAGRIIQSSTSSPAFAADGGSFGAATASFGGGQAGPFPANTGSAAIPTTASGDDGLVNDLVGLSVDSTAFRANGAVLRTAREMEDRLLDIIA